jgi:hypothetical protein
MELESRTRGACARPENGSLNRLSGSPIADTYYPWFDQYGIPLFPYA